MKNQGRINITVFVEFYVKKEPRTHISQQKQQQLTTNKILYAQFQECVPKSEIMTASIPLYQQETNDVIHHIIRPDDIKFCLNALKSQIYTKYLKRNIINPIFHIKEDLRQYGFDAEEQLSTK